MSNVTTAPPPPRLILLDAQTKPSSNLPSEIVFQYQPTGLSEDTGGNWSSSTALNRADPILQYVGGEQRGFSFEARLFADNSDLSIEELVEALRAATTRDDELKRPPRWNFVWGSFVNETVVVKSIGNVRFDMVRSDGTLRGALLQVTLLVYRTIDVALAEDEGRVTDTFFSVTRSGEQWEDVAAREYGDPILGELLRRRNPGLLFPGQKPGRVVKLPKTETLRNEEIEPDSAPLRRTEEGLSLRARVYEARSRSRASAIVLR